MHKRAMHEKMIMHKCAMNEKMLKPKLEYVSIQSQKEIPDWKFKKILYLSREEYLQMDMKEEFRKIKSKGEI